MRQVNKRAPVAVTRTTFTAMPAESLFAIRDDDTSFFTDPDELESVYGAYFGRVPISLAVVPFAVPVHQERCFTPDYPNDAEVPLETNGKLVEWIRNRIGLGHVEIVLHGYSHLYREERDGWKGEYHWKADARLAEETRRGRAYLETLLETRIRVFVPPGKHDRQGRHTGSPPGRDGSLRTHGTGWRPAVVTGLRRGLHQALELAFTEGERLSVSVGLRGHQGIAVVCPDASCRPGGVGARPGNLCTHRRSLRPCNALLGIRGLSGDARHTVGARRPGTAARHGIRAGIALFRRPCQ